MTVLKTGSTLTTGTAGGDTAPGLQCTVTSSDTDASHTAFQITDYISAPIFFVSKISNGQTAVYGDYIGAFRSGGSFPAARLDGIRHPACLQLADGTANGIRTWAGTGVPSSTTIGGAASLGDLYIRRDTPTTSLQRIYVCTIAGTPGTWVGRF